MIIGMIPMALGLGEGAEQNAPLGRAVIGGLLFATVSTLLFVPVVFAGVHERLARRRAAARRARTAARRHRCCRRAERWPSTPHRRPPIRRRRSMPAQRARVARGTRIAVVVVLVLLAVGAGRTIVGRMANAQDPRGQRQRGRGAVREDDGRRAPASGGQTLALPGTLQGFRRRRSRRARPATSSAGPRTSAAASRRASCSPRSSRPRSTSSCRRPMRRASQTAASLGAGEEHGRALGGAAQEGRRLAAGARRAAQRR